MRNIEKKILQGLKLFTNTICLKKMFAEKSNKLLKNISFKTEIRTKGNKILL